MPSQTITGSIDAHTEQARSTYANTGTGTRIHVNGLSGSIRYSYIFFPIPEAVRRGATIRRCSLRFYVINSGSAWNGSHIISARRVESTWKEQTVTYATGPVVNPTAYPTTITNPVDGQEITINFTQSLQVVALGGNWFGIRLEINTSGLKFIHSTESPFANKRPQMDLEWALLPLPPADQRPSGGRSVTISRPPLLWTFRDNFGDTTQAASQVEVRTLTDVLVYDSTMVSNAIPEHHLGSPPGGAPAFTPMTSGQELKWRVKARDGDGLVSDWSPYAAFRYDSTATLTLNQPPAPPLNMVEETTPPIIWTHSGLTQSQIEIRLHDWDENLLRFKEIYRLPRQNYSTNVFTLPPDKITKENNNLRIDLRVWDQFAREDLPDAPAYREATREFRYVPSRTPAPAQNFSVVQEGTTPAVIISFTRSIRPDWFALKVDGEIIRGRINPSDIETTTPGVYAFRFWEARPKQSHDYQLEAVVLDGSVLKHSSSSIVRLTVTPQAAWLYAPDSDIRIAFLGRETPSEDIGDSEQVFEIIGRRSPVTVSSGVRGYEGSMSGLLGDYLGTSAREYRDRLLRLKGFNNTEPIRLIFADRNIPVALGRISCPPSGDLQGLYQVEFNYRQIGEFFSARL